MSKLRIQRLEMDNAETIAIRNFKKAQRDAVVEEYLLRRKLYERQLYYHPIVLATVIVIVLTGVVFCGIQVWRDIHSGVSNTTTFKLSKEGLELSSSVVGLISLGLSFLFFYLYVTSIYQISDSNVSNPHEATIPKQKDVSIGAQSHAAEDIILALSPALRNLNFAEDRLVRRVRA